jgi:hypothetical protein
MAGTSSASTDFAPVFAALKKVIEPWAARLAVKVDTPREYWLTTKGPSPFPQHKGNPLDVTWVNVGKSYVSFHLMPLYMSPLTKGMSEKLKKRMHGKTCFNFQTAPEPEILAELAALVESSLKQWSQ